MRPWYRFWRWAFRAYFRLYHRGRICYAERLPAHGPVLLAANHASFLDPPFLGLACNREVFYLGRDTLFRSRLLGALLRSWNCLPIRREGGDIAAMRTVMRLLEQGKAVLMFPEGTRSRDGRLQQPRAGIGMIVARANVPVVPMRIFGTERAMPRGARWPRPVRVTVCFGEPFSYPLPAELQKLPAAELKTLYAEIGREIMRRIEALGPPKKGLPSR